MNEYSPSPRCNVPLTALKSSSTPITGPRSELLFEPVCREGASVVVATFAIAGCAIEGKGFWLARRRIQPRSLIPELCPRFFERLKKNSAEPLSVRGWPRTYRPPANGTGQGIACGQGTGSIFPRAVHDPRVFPSNLPVPIDDGAARHLVGELIADITLYSTKGGEPLALRDICATPTVLFFYPRTGIAGKPPSPGFQGEDWDSIPGARGCTPQNCGFRDVHREFATLGVQIFGVSTQTSDYQREFKERNGITFDYLSDVDLLLVTSMGLPTFEFPIESGGSNRLIKRMAWFVKGGRIEHVWYPIFPPGDNASRVLEWLQRR